MRNNKPGRSPNPQNPNRMSRQLSFTGFDAAPRVADRVFFAIFPAADAAERIARLATGMHGEHGLLGKPLPRERFHVTLNHLGDYLGLPQGVVDMATEAGAGVTMLPFEVAFDRMGSFRGRPGNRPLVLRGGDDLAALMAFQQALGEAMAKVGLGRWVERRFTPHVTLLYDDIAVGERPIEPIGWTVREFVLVHSLLGQTRHVPLARWPLLG